MKSRNTVNQILSRMPQTAIERKENGDSPDLWCLKPVEEAKLELAKWIQNRKPANIVGYDEELGEIEILRDANEFEKALLAELENTSR